MRKLKLNKKGWGVVCCFVLLFVSICIASGYSSQKLVGEHANLANQIPSPVPSTLPSSIPISEPTLMLSASITTAVSTNDELYPNSVLTPGDTFPAVTAEQLCTPGYSSSVRDVPISEKEQVYAEYGVSYPQPVGSYEVDHFIPLELGGSNSLKNLWLEPASPRPGFHEKDVVENYLHKQVCAGALSLTQAQNEIRIDWYQVYTQIAGSTTKSSATIPTQPVNPNDAAPGSVQNNQATALCNDGSYSYSASYRGACSHHRGVQIFYR